MRAPAELTSKLETLAWYARRPQLYRELLRRAAALRVSSDKGRARDETIRAEVRSWCETVLRGREEVLSGLGLRTEVPAVSALFPEAWQYAERSVAACPFKMGGPADVDLLFHLTRECRADRIVETGVANGWSSLAILLALAERGGSQLVSVDMPYAKNPHDDWVGCAVPAYLRAPWRLVRLPDRDALPRILRELGHIDLFHYDSDKSYDGRIFGYRIAWDHLRPGGLLMSDDVEDNFAFRDFAAEVGQAPLVLKKSVKAGNFAGLLRRPS